MYDCFSPVTNYFSHKMGKYIHYIIIIDITKHMVLTKEYNIPNIITWWNSPQILDINK